MEHILITGATGYIGSNLLKVLQRNNFRLHILIREESDCHGLDLERIGTYVYSDNNNSLPINCTAYELVL